METQAQEELERRLRVLLPETYRVFDDEVQPRSMGSAGLKFGPDGKVLWDSMWRSFCDLAMAGGPPHRGKLLQAPRLSAQDAGTEAYQQVAAEICRGLTLVTGLFAEPSTFPGWICIYCTSAAMAGWLMRAITMENVTAVARGLALHLPAGPDFRVQKEIKNVITSVAKTCHYWQDHMSEDKHDQIAALLRCMDGERTLVAPDLQLEAGAEGSSNFIDQVAEDISTATGLSASPHGYGSWLGIDCQRLDAAVWMMRALATGNILARREDNTVFLPFHRRLDPQGASSLTAVTEAHRLARMYGVF